MEAFRAKIGRVSSKTTGGLAGVSSVIVGFVIILAGLHCTTPGLLRRRGLRMARILPLFEQHWMLLVPVVRALLAVIQQGKIDGRRFSESYGDMYSAVPQAEDYDNVGPDQMTWPISVRTPPRSHVYVSFGRCAIWVPAFRMRWTLIPPPRTCLVLPLRLSSRALHVGSVDSASDSGGPGYRRVSALHVHF